MSGQLFGHYRILEKIGTGGMGEVFRAHDERLGRDVALKLISPASNANPDLVRRFEQEARAAAALNHPNIVAIYDVGFQGETPYIVSELLEGETLRKLVVKGQLTVRQTKEYTLQIVRGLIAAHERRIVHRDLKPENLFVTRDGRLKILDFGVAKLQPEKDERSVETMTTVTKSGAVVGTVAYMSPEQLRGRHVDHRSDIFSVGAIVYEMLSGRRAFQGETEVDTMTAVLREEPLPIEVANIPSAFQDIVSHCLEKEPENRFQSARDLAFALESLSGTASSREIPVFKPPKLLPKVLPWAVVAALAIGLFFLGRYLQPEVIPPSFHRLTYEEGTIYSARFTPDGRSIIYTGAWNNKPQQLFSTVANSLLAQPLEFRDATLLAISPTNDLALQLHGTHSGMFETEHGMLAVAPMAGGAPREILYDARWADWDNKGQLIVVHYFNGHSRLEYPIGHVLYESSGWISHLRMSPQHDKIAFMDHPVEYDDGGSVSVMDLSGKVQVLSSGWESEDGLAWAPGGKEIWFTAVKKGNNRNLLAVDFSGRTRTLLDITAGITLQDVSPDGRALLALNTERLGLAAGSFKGKSDIELSWHDWNIAKDISPDDQSILFEDASEVAGAEYAVAIRKIDGGLPIRLGPGSAGSLSPDGKWAISVSVTEPVHLTLLPIGPGQAREIPTVGLKIQHGIVHFTDDGKHIVVDGNEPGRPPRCFMLGLDGETPQAITPEGVTGGIISPDGRWVVGSGGNPPIALYAFGSNERHLIPNFDPSFVPVQWTSDSSALYGYRMGELPSKIYVLNIHDGKLTVIYELKPLYPAGVVTVAPLVVSRDGTRFAYSYNQTLSTLWTVTGLK